MRWLRLAGPVAVATLLALPGAAAAGTPSGTPTTWPTPGAKAKPGKSVKISGRSESLQPRREPLVLIDEQREGKKRALTLSADVLFAKDSARLNPSANKTLDAVAKRIEDAGVRGPVTVTGHTDTDGSKTHNQDLSERRAKAVADRLEPKLSGTEAKLEATGKGETSPVVDPERTEADKARNRRVTITYTTTKSQAPPQRSDTDISVPDTQPAKVTDEKVQDSRAAYRQTFTDEDGKSELQIDVMNLDEQGRFIYARLRVTAISTAGDTFDTSYVFTGDTGVSDDASNTVLYDEPGGTKLKYYVTGKGEPIRSGLPGSLAKGEHADVWFMYPAPERHRDMLDMYVPTFGVFKSLSVKD